MLRYQFIFMPIVHVNINLVLITLKYEEVYNKFIISDMVTLNITWRIYFGDSGTGYVREWTEHKTKCA